VKTLVIVQAHRPAEEMLKLLAKNYVLAGADLAGVDEADSPVACWPNCFRMVCAVEAGKPMRHPVRLLEVARMALASRYDRFVLAEYGSLFLGKIPDTPEEAFCGCIIGPSPPDWNVGSFPVMKPPYIANRPILERWLRAAESLIVAGKTGNGSTDMFVSMCCRKALLHVYGLSGVHALNGSRNASDIVIARKRVEEGIWHLHGVKRADHLKFILQKSDLIPSDAIMQ
jgi:hypothetical protein